MPPHRITLIHATSVAIAPIAEAFAWGWPEAEVYNFLDDSLAPDLERAGRLDDGMIDRFRNLARYAMDCGTNGILFTCSAFGSAIEAVAAELSPVPVLKPNEAMFEAALKIGGKLGMLATFEPSVPSMEREFEQLAKAACVEPMLESLCVPGAMEALRAGDADTHNRLIAEAAPGLAHCDAVMLAHFSTAQARSTVATALNVPILTSPDSAVKKIKAALSTKPIEQ